MIDLDGFKGVNDTFGHDAGDALLIEVGSAAPGDGTRNGLRGAPGRRRIRPPAAGAAPTRATSSPLAERVLRRLAEPVRIQGQHVRIGASLGIAFHPQDGLDVDTWFKHADMALYSAKNGGRGIYRCFDEQLSQAVTEHHLLESDLRRALDGGGAGGPLPAEIRLQTHWRSLVSRRWRGGGTPAAVIFRRRSSSASPRTCGLIGRLGRWVLERACKCVATWEPRYPVAVNVSVMQLHDDGLKDHIACGATADRAATGDLEIEVTESVMADDDQTVLENLRAIKGHGHPDRAGRFRHRLLQPELPAAVSRSTRSRSTGLSFRARRTIPAFGSFSKRSWACATILGLRRSARASRRRSNWTCLRDRGCTEVQGYLLGRPMPSEQVGDFIRSNVRPVGTPRAHHNGQERILMVS